MIGDLECLEISQRMSIRRSARSVKLFISMEAFTGRMPLGNKLFFVLPIFIGSMFNDALLSLQLLTGPTHRTALL